MTKAQTEARAIAERFPAWPTRWGAELRNRVIEEIATALAAKDAELAAVHQRYVDANEARIDAEAISRTGAGKLRPLEWVDADEGMCTKWRAAALGGHYELVDFGKDDPGFAVNFHWGRPLSFWFIQGEPDERGPTGPKMFPTLKAAKAAAQADYERRILSAITTEPAAPEGEPVTLTYKNWRGEVAKRTIVPNRIWFGSTDWHPEPQWLITAFDVEKQADRDFALKDFGVTRPAEQAVTEAALRVLKWVEPITGDNRDAKAAQEELDSVKAIKAAIEARR